MKERILEFLKKENKTSSQFAEEIGVQASSISHIISGRNKPSLDFVIKMLQKYDDLSTDWLIFGKGNMYKESTAGDLFAGLDDQTADMLRPSSSPVVQDSPSPGLESSPEPRAGSVPSTISQVILVYSDNTFRALSGDSK